ncbi:MAG: hypothetical protein M3142_06115 [Bacteroidota bacterium]|nr:hypothetical protein [Bacteroidota bacterium]
MFPACSPTFKSNFFKANAFLKPSREAKEAFLENLSILLAPLKSEGKPESQEIECLNVLQNLFSLTPDQVEFENSSPVCYAQTSGLRSGFEDSFNAPQNNPPDTNLVTNLESLSTNRLQSNPEFTTAIRDVCTAIALMAKTTNASAFAPGLEKQIADLVYQLYYLTPAEIAVIESQEYLTKAQRRSTANKD